MQLEEVIAQAIEEGKSLTTNEREKAAGPYDAVYLGEKIRYHARRVFYTRLLVVLLYVDAVLALVFAFSYDALTEASRLWFKWLLVVIAVLAVYVNRRKACRCANRFHSGLLRILPKGMVCTPRWSTVFVVRCCVASGMGITKSQCLFAVPF